MPTSTAPVRKTPLDVALFASAASLGLVFAYSFGYNLFLLAPSIYLLQVYDRVLSSRSIDTLVMLTLIISTAVIVGALLDVLRRAALSRIGSWLDHRLRPAIMTASFEYAFRADARTASDCYRDLAIMRQFLDSPASALLFDIPWAPVFLGLLFLVHPLLGVIGVGGAILIFCFALATEFATRTPAARANVAQAMGASRLATALSHIQVIRAMGMQDGAARLIYQDAEAARAAQDTVSRRTEMLQALSKPTRMLTQVWVMGAAAFLVLQYDRSAGIIFVSSLLLGRGLAPVEGAIGAWKAFAYARGAYMRLNAVLNAVAHVGGSAGTPIPAPVGHVLLDNVSFVPAGGSYALKSVSLRLSAGECLAVIGASGSGKSTLGRIIAGISPPTLGSALIDSVDVTSLRNTGGGRYIGYLPQDIELFGGAIKEIIGRLDGSDLDTVVEAAKIAGLHDTIMRLPQGYDTDIGEGGALLRAQRQRLGLARAVYGNPRLVVLDEPNASLDYVGERVLLDAIARMKASCITVVVITHRLGILPVTDKIAILQNGSLNAFGDSEEIYNTHIRRPQIPSGAEGSEAEAGEESER
jgi:ATP-binding cassette subfamily C protein